MSEKIWLIGTGDIASQHARVLDGLGKGYLVVGRGDVSASIFEEKTKRSVMRGGVEGYIDKSGEIPEFAIVTVYPLSLKDVTIFLLKKGVKNILVEKPAGINHKEIEEIAQAARKNDAHVYVAYNRRFYASVDRAKAIIEEDGGLTSFNFEFTEWGHVIEKLKKPQDELRGWFMANSTHVVDLAFYLGGLPMCFSSIISGSLPWHPCAAQYAGSGVTASNVPFTYKANWDSAGRWSLEFLTKNRKLIFEPIEELKEQKKGSIAVEKVDIDDSLDREYKAGLFLQMKAFLNGDYENMISIEEQARISNVYELMETTGIYSSSDDWNSFYSK